MVCYHRIGEREPGLPILPHNGTISYGAKIGGIWIGSLPNSMWKWMEQLYFRGCCIVWVRLEMVHRTAHTQLAAAECITSKTQMWGDQAEWDLCREYWFWNTSPYREWANKKYTLLNCPGFFTKALFTKVLALPFQYAFLRILIPLSWPYVSCMTPQVKWLAPWKLIENAYPMLRIGLTVTI